LHELWDTIRLVAQQSKPKQQTWFFWFNYAKRLHMKGYQWALYEENSTLAISINQLPWQTKIKSFVQNKVQETYGKNSYAWLLLGMIIGDISLLSKVEYQQFIDSGLVHMLVVSGWNILLVIVFLNAVLFFIPLYPRTIIIILWIIAYALVCWMDSSILRAVIMWVISLISIFPWRFVNKRRILGITYIIMLLINPYYLVYDLGFLLSFSAILWLTIWWEIQEQKNNKNKEKPVNKTQKTRRKIYTSYLLPNIFVSIAIFPVIIFFMGKINLLSIWANILVIPIIPIVLLYWVWSCVIFSFRKISFLPQIGKIFIDWIFQVNSLFSKRWIYLFVDEQRIKILLFLWMIFFLFRWLKKQYVQASSTRDRTGK
jgi:competence protein ComEC